MARWTQGTRLEKLRDEIGWVCPPTEYDHWMLVFKKDILHYARYIPDEAVRDIFVGYYLNQESFPPKKYQLLKQGRDVVAGIIAHDNHKPFVERIDAKTSREE